MEAGKLNVVNLLIEHGAQVDLSMGEESPLTRGGDIKMVKALLGKVHIKSISDFTSCRDSVTNKEMGIFLSYVSSQYSSKAWAC